MSWRAIARVVAGGAQLSALPPPKSDQFKKILENGCQFRADQRRWFAIADTRAELAV
jgi:hypothetical protein